MGKELAKDEKLNLKLSVEELATIVDGLLFAKEMMELLAEDITKEHNEKYDVEDYIDRARACAIMINRLNYVLERYANGIAPNNFNSKTLN